MAKVILKLFQINSNFSTTTTLETQNLWTVLKGGRCSEVFLCYKDSNLDDQMVVVIGKWSLTQVILYTDNNKWLQ